MAAQNHLSQLIAAVAMQRDPSSTIKTDVDEHEYAPQLGVHFGAAHRMSQFLLYSRKFIFETYNPCQPRTRHGQNKSTSLDYHYTYAFHYVITYPL